MNYLRFFHGAFVLLACLPSGAAELGDRRVSMLFKDTKSDYSVIEVEEYAKDSLGVGWHNSYGDGGLYWGSPTEGFFKLRRTWGGCNVSQGRNWILAPSAHDLKREAELVFDFKYTRFLKSGPVIRGTVTVRCDGEEAVLQANQKEKRALTELIQKREIPLNSLPDVRRIKYAFKFPESEKYILLDSSELNAEHNEVFEAIVWENGQFRFEDVDPVEHYYDTLTVNFKNGDSLFFSSIPLDRREPKKATFLKNERGFPLLEVRVTPEVIAMWGLPAARYKQSLLRTPCELLLSEAPRRRAQGESN